MLLAAVVALAAGGNAAAPLASPALAAGKALTACIMHASGASVIAPSNAAALADNNLQVQATAPDRLRSMQRTPYGSATFARSPAAEGEVWAVGYDGGTCMVMVLGTAVEPVEAQLARQFAAPDDWHGEPIAQIDAGARWSGYGSDAHGRHLTAQMKVQPLPTTPVRGLVMVTVSPEAKKN